MNAPVATSRSEATWQARKDLAAAYRAMALYGMTDLIYNHISLRSPDTPENMLINSYGLFYDEVTASSLVEVNAAGDILDGPPGAVINKVGYVIHNAVHEARPDVNCVIHTHTRADMAVSAMSCGLPSADQNAMFFHGAVSYHDYSGPACDRAEQLALQKSLGSNDVMILRNHGLLVCGPSVSEAFVTLYLIENAFKAQVDILAVDPTPRLCSESVAQRTRAAFMGFGGRRPDNTPTGRAIEWSAILRRLDAIDPSWRT